ncbi:MAG: hypothetical protein Q4G25_02180 [Paracoccus sp. (in: a-proteobacteria)]|nr:hypothetical protein [Paracoccus sp. (in: a-proteobacteria)]
MDNMRWLIRAVRWVRNPPGTAMVRMVFGILAAGLLLLLLEHLGLWPDWATLPRGRGAF